MTEQEIANKIQRILDSLGRDSVKTLVITLDDSTERVSCGCRKIFRSSKQNAIM